ncbi:MAG: adenylosuccinate synthase [Chloroflexi bacterium]|nr:adenylosuccinate synthase [Chloroflexota bacterium]
MPAYALIGAQWGDEGKGKVVDYLAAQAQWVVRYAGGNNAGHTVINEDGTFSLHLVPSGVFQPQVSCVIGNGVVVDPDVLLGEITDLQSRGVDTSRIFLSDRAHLIMPYHIRLDALEEAARGREALGTTGKGVGPAYVDKAARMGIRAGDLADLEEGLLPRLKQIVEAKNRVLTKVYEDAPLSLDDVFDRCVQWWGKLKGIIGPTDLLLQDALDRGETVLLEGAQGTLLDLDHGTYPYVTSSSSSAGGASAGLGIRPQAIIGVIGVFKAYCTRVGSGPMPTEMQDETADKLRERAWEYGTTTGRARRIGWFDAVAGRYSQRINGFTSLVLTRLDVLDGFPSVKICVGYRVDGKAVDHFPGSTGLLERCQPVYEEMPGWDRPTAGATEMAQLPKEAVAYVKRLEDLIGCSFHLISTGPHRDETVALQRMI